MTQRALIICPGRGSYTAEDLHSLEKWRGTGEREATAAAFVAAADDYRRAVGSPTISELDGAEKFSTARHTPGENAGPLIFTASAVDWACLPREHFLPVAVCGNSMGWYSTLFVGGALEFGDALRVIDTMSKSQRHGVLGGQIIIPFVDEDWRADRARRTEIETAVARVRDEGHVAAISIELGGFLVLGGDDRGIQRLKDLLPLRKFGKRDYPFQLAQHAAFHTSLMTEHSALGMTELADLSWKRPELSMIDGRGHVFRPHATETESLRRYTFIHQALETYDFTTGVRVGLREFAPDVLLLLGPGDTLGGAIGQIIVREGWQGIRSREDFMNRQASDRPLLVSMGRKENFDRLIRSKL